MTSDDSDSRARMGPLPPLPDPAICRAVIIVRPDLIKCLVSNTATCPYAMNYGGAYFCNHPNKQEIVKITEAER